MNVVSKMSFYKSGLEKALEQAKNRYILRKSSQAKMNRAAKTKNARNKNIQKAF